MKLEWILHPLVYYALLAIGMTLCLYLFVSVQRQIQLAGAHAERETEKLQSKVRRLELDLSALKPQVREMSEGMATMTAPKPAPSGLNMNSRSQALRMARRGDRADQIAAALQLPHSEVNLLLKVHRAVSELGSLKALDRAVSEQSYDVPSPVRAARG